MVKRQYVILRIKISQNLEDPKKIQSWQSSECMHSLKNLSVASHMMLIASEIIPEGSV